MKGSLSSTIKIGQIIPLKSAHLAPQKLWQLVPSAHQGWRKTFNNDKEKKKDARNLGTTADSSTASCSMRADSTSKGPGNIEYTEMQYSREEELTYSVARRYDEVISAGKEPKIPILWQALISATRNAVDGNGLVHLVLHSAIAGEIKVASKAISSGLQVLAVPLKSMWNDC